MYEIHAPSKNTSGHTFKSYSYRCFVYTLKYRPCVVLIAQGIGWDQNVNFMLMQDMEPLTREALTGDDG